MERKSSSAFDYLDIFGMDVKFHVAGNDFYRTRTGAYLTSLYIIIVVSLFVGFGIDMYQRKNPKVTFNTQTVPYYASEFSNNNFTYAYRVEDVNGKMFINSSILTPMVYYGYAEQIKGVWEQKFVQILENQRCSNLSNIEEKEKTYNVSLKEW